MIEKTIVLDSKRKNEAFVDRDEYFKKYSIYDNQGNFKRLMDGSPIIKNIDGSYYYLDKLPAICLSGMPYLDGFIREMTNPVKVGFKYKFVWSK